MKVLISPYLSELYETPALFIKAQNLYKQALVSVNCHDNLQLMLLE